MPSDFSNLQDSGKACVGCGRTNVILSRLATYAVAYACARCFKRHWNCGNINCKHLPHPERKCTECPCEFYIHGLAAEFDRQYDKCVGQTPKIHYCSGIGVNTGKCERLVFMEPDGSLPRLCGDCKEEWMRAFQQGKAEAEKLIGMDTTNLLPN